MTEDYPVRLVCQALKLPRSTYYYYQPRPREDKELKVAIENVAEAWPTYGYRRVTAQLRREGWVVNGKKIARLMREMGLQVARKRQKRRTTDSRT